MSLVSHEVRADVDDHVFIVIRQRDKPTLSIDLTNEHHRRAMSVRVDGVSVLGFYADIESPKMPTGERMHRFCSFCGERHDLFSSRPHSCALEETERTTR